MTQVIKFFGWLLVGVGLTLFVFGHLSMVFVYGWAYVGEAIFPSDDALSSLWAFPVALAPGGLLLGMGFLMQRFDERAAAREDTGARDSASEADTKEDTTSSTS